MNPGHQPSGGSRLVVPESSQCCVHVFTDVLVSKKVPPGQPRSVLPSPENKPLIFCRRGEWRGVRGRGIRDLRSSYRAFNQPPIF